MAHLHVFGKVYGICAFFLSNYIYIYIFDKSNFIFSYTNFLNKMYKFWSKNPPYTLSKP
jgi:hypothetical protein